MKNIHEEMPDEFGHAHAKTHEAAEHHKASELAASRAQEKYSSMSEAQRNADAARQRQNEVCILPSSCVTCCACMLGVY